MPSFDSDDDSDVEGENLIQRFFPGYKPYLSKLSPEADEIFDNQKIDDDLPEITIPNTQTMFKVLDNRKIPKELKFFTGGNDGDNELKFHAMLNIGMLNKSNEHFLDYLLSDFAREVLSKNKMKIHLDT